METWQQIEKVFWALVVPAAVLVFAGCLFCEVRDLILGWRNKVR